MNDMKIPYGCPYKDMSEMDIANEKLTEKTQYKEVYSNKEKNNCPKMVLAMAYVLDQAWETPYDVNEGLKRGTLFPSLDKPFLGGGRNI